MTIRSVTFPVVENRYAEGFLDIAGHGRIAGKFSFKSNVDMGIWESVTLAVEFPDKDTVRFFLQKGELASFTPDVKFDEREKIAASSGTITNFKEFSEPPKDSFKLDDLKCFRATNKDTKQLYAGLADAKGPAKPSSSSGPVLDNGKVAPPSAPTKPMERRRSRPSLAKGLDKYVSVRNPKSSDPSAARAPGGIAKKSPTAAQPKALSTLKSNIEGKASTTPTAAAPMLEELASKTTERLTSSPRSPPAKPARAGTSNTASAKATAKPKYQVCGVDQKPIDFLSFDLLDKEDVLTAGIRNDVSLAETYRTLPGVSGYAIQLSGAMDLSDSVGKLIPVGFRDRAHLEVIPKESSEASEPASDKSYILPVSIPGLSSAKAVNRAAADAAKQNILNLVVIGHANAVSQARLDAVQASLEKGYDGFDWNVTWFEMDADGGLEPGRKFARFTELLSVARSAPENDTVKRTMSQHETFATFVGNFERVMKGHPDKVAMAIWIKGTYMPPTSAPLELEKLIAAVGESGKVAVDARGRVKHWLYAVSDVMPNPIAGKGYLSGAIDRVGTVDVNSAADTRGLINDPGLMATKIRTIGLRNAPVLETPEDMIGLSPNEFLLSASDVMERVGLVMSRDGLHELRKSTTALGTFIDAKDPSLPKLPFRGKLDVTQLINVFSSADGVIDGIRLAGKPERIPERIAALRARELRSNQESVSGPSASVTTLGVFQSLTPVFLDEFIHRTKGSPCTHFFADDGDINLNWVHQ